MKQKEEMDANLKVVTSGGGCTPADRALLSEFSAKHYESDTVKKIRME